MAEQLEVVRDPHQGHTDSQYETNLAVWGENHTFESLRKPIQDTPYWTELTKLLPRFHAFHQEKIDPALFTELMGYDVVPEKHGPFQARTVAIPLIQAQQESNLDDVFSPELNDSFVAYHVIHDDHEGEEARLRGASADLAHPLKNTQTEAHEFNIWSTIHQKLFPQHAANEIEKVKTILATEAWNVSERIGYIATALQAAHVARHTPNLSPQERSVFTQLSRTVIGRQIDAIEQARSRIVLADIILMQTVETRKEIATWEPLT